jgi:hypothetical protein
MIRLKNSNKTHILRLKSTFLTAKMIFLQKILGKAYREQLTEGDLQSLQQEERTLRDLAYKYFAYLVVM